MKTVTCNGASIPQLGFGTFELEGKTARRMVEAALDIGYRHVDTAQAYRNEQEVGEAIAASDVSRDDIFLTTKVWPDRFSDGELQQSVEESLARLGVDSVDLLLLHWPNPDIPLEETIGALNEVKKDGRTKHIGVSNFTSDLLDEAFSLSEAKLVTNQVEYHPLLNQDVLLDAVRSRGMSLTAYSPVAQGKLFGMDELVAIGSGYGKNAGQVAIRWLLQQEKVVAIPRTSDVDHARENFDVFDFELSDDEMARIDELTKKRRRQVNPPDLAPDWD